MQLAAVLAALVAGTSAAAGSPFDGWEPHRYCNDLEGIGATRVPPLRADQAARVESLEQVQVRGCGEAVAGDAGYSSAGGVCNRCFLAMARERHTQDSSAGTSSATTP